MNLELLRTFDASYPEHNDGVLDSGSEALITRFNRRGTMLAVGCNDGRIARPDVKKGRSLATRDYSGTS